MSESYVGGIDVFPKDGEMKVEMHVYEGIPRWLDLSEMTPKQLREYEVGVVGPENKHQKSLDVSTLPKSVQNRIKGEPIRTIMRIQKIEKGTKTHKVLKKGGWIRYMRWGSSGLGVVGGISANLSHVRAYSTLAYSGLSNSQINDMTGGCP